MYLAPFCLRLQKQQSKVKRCQTGAHIFFADHSVVLSSLLLLTLMQKLTPEQKHSILTHYTSRRDGETLDQIFALHGVKASRQSFFVWMKQWDGTPASLSRAAGSGRPRLLSNGDVKRHVATRIRSCNRSGTPVRYTRLLTAVQAATGQQVSVRTLRRSIWQGGAECQADSRQEANCRRRYIHIHIP